MKYIGIDIGGMTIKAGVVTEDGAIVCKKVATTRPDKADVEIVKDIAILIDGILEENKIAVNGKAVPGNLVSKILYKLLHKYSLASRELHGAG